MNVSTCKLFLVIVFNLLGVGLLMLSQNASPIVKHLAAGKAVLAEGSEAAETFSKPPVDTHIKFYFFDLQNKAEVLLGETPIVKQKGPYAFRLSSSKTMTWNTTKITYVPKKAYFFDEAASDGSLNDKITTLNPGAITLVEYNASKVPDLFNTASVEDFLFNGVEADGVPWAYFQDKNDTAEGTFEAFTGQGNVEELNRIIRSKRPSEEEISTELECEEVRGTNGERFPPFSVPPPKLSLYNPQLCRPWDLYYSKLVAVNGLDCVRFSNGHDFLSRTFNDTIDDCLMEESMEVDADIRGIFNARYCQELGAPILYSLPHFLNADPKLLEDVKGLEPSEEKHNFYLDVFPALGFVVDMRVRVQVNFRLKQHGHPLNELKETIYPVFWQEMMLLKENSDEAASIVYKKVVFPQKLMFWISLSVGALLVIVAELMLLSGMCSKSSSGGFQTNDAYVTYNSRNDRSRVNMR